MMTLRTLLASALAFLPLAEASAGSGTITTKDAAGVTRTFVVTTDGSGNFLAQGVICDATAGANCAAVDSSGRVSVTGAGGAFPVTAASGSFASGALASGSVASGAMVDLGAVADAAATAGGTGTLSAKLRLMTTQLGTLNTTLGSPFQAGGSIGNTTFAATQATAASLNATVVGTGTFAAQLTGSTNNINNISGTISLPTGASTAANQATEIASLATIATNTGAPIPAGTALIGNVGSATGAAPPAGAVYLGANASGATGGLLAGMVQCDSSAVYDASTNGSTELKSLTSGRAIYVCGYTILSGGTVNVKLIYGTGTACATGSNNMTPAYQLTAQVGLVDSAPFYRGMKTASANALCINTSGGVAVQAVVYYAVL